MICNRVWDLLDIVLEINRWLMVTGGLSRCKSMGHNGGVIRCNRVISGLWWMDKDRNRSWDGNRSIHCDSFRQRVNFSLGGRLGDGFGKDQISKGIGCRVKL